MVFIDAGAAHRVQHDINQVYEAIARLLSKIHLENSRQQLDAIPRIDIDVEEGQKQAVLEGETVPALSGQKTLPALEGQPERLQLEGKDFAALPYRDLEPLPLSPRPPLKLDPTEAPVLIQLGDAVIERPLKLLPQALEQLQPEEVSRLRQTLEYPVGSEQFLPEETYTRIEVEGIERFSAVDGQIKVNDLYPEMVGVQAEAIAIGRESTTPEQIENLSRYLLQHYVPEQPDGQRSLVVTDNHQAIKVSLHPKQGIALDFEDTQQDIAAQTPTDLKVNLNTAYQLLHRELERQQSLPDELPRQPEMQLRPISEVEITTGQQLGNVEVLHDEVLSEAPVVLVSVDDLGRPMVTSSVAGHVEVTEDEVKTKEMAQTVQSGIQEEQRMDLSALDQLQSFFDQTGARELESPETGMLVQPQESGLFASTPEGRVLVLDGDRLQTNFTSIEIQQLGEMAQEATYALAANEISIGTVQQFNNEMEREG